MKNIIRNTFIGLVIGGTSIAYGSVPQMSVTVSDSSGKPAYRGATNTQGTFATGTLKPGGYVVQFTTKNSDIKGKNYALVVSAGKKKVTAGSVAGEKFAAGGVAMKIDVGTGLSITGQVAAEDKNSAPMGRNGKPMVWISKQLGSNLAAHWAESDSAEAKQAQTAGSYSTKNLQDRQSQGVSPQ